MPTRPLPPDPSLVQLRKQARELQGHLRSGDPEALALAAEHLPPDRTPSVKPAVGAESADGAESLDSNESANAKISEGSTTSGYPLHLAQLILARSYGFRSWPRMTDHLQWVQKLSRAPDVNPPDPDPIDRFLLHAVLRYSVDDGPERRALAGRMLAADPSIGRADLYTACVAADPVAVRAFLAADPSSAGRVGGVLRWEPLLYVTYARLDPPPPRENVLATAQLLLAAGADPNAGYLWHGETCPFTALTGVFGSGEGGSANQPHHPYALDLARLLLEAGADPNDGQTLYNRMFERDNSHLVMLFEYGLGTGDGGPWRRRFLDRNATPAEMVRGDLSWAVSHGMADRVRLLASHGVDLAAPLREWSTRRPTSPMALALQSGRPEIARLLVDLGAPEEVLEPETRMVGALLSGDAALVAELTSPRLLARVRRRHPSLVLRAAVAGSRSGVELLLTNGFDVNALGRQDIPVEQEWETALHFAAGQGELEMTRLLLEAGADPTITDRRFGGTPLGWAEHFGRVETAELLRTLST
ncbi:ankyrin repeat protein [Nakamurella sp. UYEF19]|uniref:ankyrin repeat domain-containing protein n=1 Tax=Nakamurella sp. UYEF19 TaxID=1756392 RepID=UPI00339130AA